MHVIILEGPASSSSACVSVVMLQHESAAHTLQGDATQASVVMRELEFRGKGLRWIKNFKTNIAKEIVALMQEEGQRPRHQDQELKEMIMEYHAYDTSTLKGGKN